MFGCLLFIFFDDSIKGHVPEQCVDWSCSQHWDPSFIRRVQESDHKCQTILQPKAPSQLSSPGLWRNTGLLCATCYWFTLFSPVNPASWGLARDLRKKNVCFRLLTSFIDSLFLFQTDLVSARRVKLRATIWLAVALLCLTGCSNNTHELEAGFKATRACIQCTEDTGPIVGCRSENIFQNIYLCYKCSFCLALKWLSR